jgi:hypothetical protein
MTRCAHAVHAQNKYEKHIFTAGKHEMNVHSRDSSCLIRAPKYGHCSPIHANGALLRPVRRTKISAFN